MNHRRTRRVVVPALIVTVWMLGPGTQGAEAYIDPGTGTQLLSSLGIVLGMVSTGIVIGFTQIKRCGGWVVAKLSQRRHERLDDS